MSKSIQSSPRTAGSTRTGRGGNQWSGSLWAVLSGLVFSFFLASVPAFAVQKSAMAQMVLTIPSRVRVSAPAHMALEQDPGNPWNAKAMARALVQVEARPGRGSNREVIAVEWEPSAEATRGACAASGQPALSALGIISTRPMLAAFNKAHALNLRIRSRWHQEVEGMFQVASVNLSGLGLKPSAAKVQDLRKAQSAGLAPMRDVAPNSVASLVELPTTPQSEFGLDLEMGLSRMPQTSGEAGVVTLTYTVL
jgi:hypothetical protein